MTEAASELGSLALLLRKIAATSRKVPTLVPGSVVARRYTVEHFLGRGGMAVVYAVRDADLDDVVALKLLHPELGADPGYQQRLRAEVRLARRVSHPNVCRVHDIGQHDDQLFVTMELVQGRTLRQLLRERDPATPPTLSSVVDVVVQIASALSAAHRAGVLHRDVKPDNVMVDDSRAVLTDFGVASLAHDRDQVVAGTPSYIAPEVLHGKAFDHRADVYSAAVLAYELATGVQPFPARTLDEAIELAGREMSVPPVPEPLGTPALRAALDRVFERALASEPSQRTASMEQFAEALAHAARAGGTAVVSGTSDAEMPSTPRTSTLQRSEVRVATALVYRSDELGTSSSGEDLERIIVDGGGTPVSIGSFEIAALFGVPVALGDDAERAVRAAQALIAHRSGRAGLDTVRVVLQAGMPTLRSNDAFESASTLARAAGQDQILTSVTTGRQLAARFDISGVEVGRTSARRIVGVRPAVPHADAATFRPRELASLVALAEDCFSHRRPRHCEVRAPAGYGKTQLRDAMIARLRERREIEWLVSRAELHGSSGPLALLQAAQPEWYAAVERAASITDNRPAAFAAAQHWLEARSERRPIGLLIEDVQWADEVSAAFIDQLVGTLDDVPVLIVTFRRTDDEPAPALRPCASIMTLGPLEPATAAQLVRKLAPGATHESIEDVVSRAGGHPFFLEELARELAAGSARAATPLPATIEAVLQVRLDRLDARSRDVVTAAAAIGPTFWRDALIDIIGDDGLDTRLSDLERLALIAPATIDGAKTGGGGERYRFVHGLVRDVAYARIAPRERRAIHAAIAGWLLRRFPALAAVDRAGSELGIEVISAFAHHLEEAGEPTRAAIAYRAAGMRCAAAALYREAADSLRRAATLAPTVDVDLASELGDVVLHADTIAEAEVWYERALAACPPDDDARRALIWHKLGNAASRRGDCPRALQCFEAGLALAAPGGTNLAQWAIRDPRTAALLYGSLGWVCGYQLGDNARGLPACQRAVALLEGTQYRRDLAQALSRLGATYMRASRFRDQLECNRRNLEIAVEMGDVTMQTTARINLGVVYSVLGDIAEAIEHSEIGRELATRSGSRQIVGLLESNLAGYYLECGRLDDAQRCLDEALAIFERVGRKVGLCETYGFAARLRGARGDLASAERWATQALALADDFGQRLDQSIALRQLAQISARLGKRSEALAALDDATARGAGLDPYEEARTHAARARVYRLLGSYDEATAARAHAVAELTRLGARRELEVIDVLDEIR